MPATRWAFWLGNVAFEDVRLPRDEFNRRRLAGKYPLDQVPVLTVDGVTYPQSAAHMAFAGKLAGLYPSDPKQGLAVDSVIATINEKLDTISPTFSESDLAKRIELRKQWNSTHGAKLYKFLDGQLAGKTYFAGDNLSVADLLVMVSVCDWLPTLDGMSAFSTTDYPALSKFKDTVNARTDIQKVRDQSAAAIAAAKAEILKQQQAQQ